ncbi:hypothetical protein J2847_005896 [Azospirillum agricola]|uniref:Acb2/Tad1 domain-containing protein n=1 Tax=Azospirillum agricola TaxID=1720247 RepID=UPI001AE3D6EB|nr:hypothetical protein [Azospirillum agricola]MBP2232567.1 hypothetical protein [Azospirillum agricola]
MAHLYNGAPNGRQAGEIQPSRFRPQYRALSDEEKALHDAIKGKASELEDLFERARALRTPVLEPITIQPGEPIEMLMGATLSFDTDYFAEGMKALELSVMWTVKGLTA